MHPKITLTMNHPYRVDYIESHILEKNTDWMRKGTVDGYFTSKEIEALLIARKKEGYELVSITPLAGIAINKPYAVNTTVGFMVTFRLQAD